MKKILQKYLKILSILILVTSQFTIYGTADDNDGIYGYIIDISPDQSYSCQTNISRLINQLLEEDIPVYWLTSDTTILVKKFDEQSKTIENKFNKGSFLIPFTDDFTKNAIATSKTFSFSSISLNLEPYKIMESKKINGYVLQKPKIAQIEGYAAAPYQEWLLKAGGFQNQKTMKPEEISSNLTNDDYNLFIWGGGYSTSTNDKFVNMGKIISLTGQKVLRKIRDFVKNGGGYIGLCYGGMMAASGFRRPSGYPLSLDHNRLLTFLPIQLNLLDIDIYKALPGGADISVEIIDKNNPIAYGLPDVIHNHSYAGGPIFVEKIFGGENVKPLAKIKNVDNIHYDFDDMKFSLWAKSNILSDETKNKIVKNWIQQSIGKIVSVTGNYGKGKVIAFGGHPEFADSRDKGMGSDEPPRTLYNSIFYSTSKSSIDIDIKNSYPVKNVLDVDAGGPYLGVAEHPIQFSGSVNNGTPPYEWCWDFEFPEPDWYYYEEDFFNTEKEQNPTFTYNYSTQNLKATLAVSDSKGNIGIDYAQIDVLSYYRHMTIDFDYPSKGNIGDEIHFNCSVTNGIPPYKYHWTFGDGTESFEQNPVHSYDESGRYKYSLTVEDQWGKLKTYGGTIRIGNQNEGAADSEGNTISEKSSFPILIVIICVMVAIIISLIFKRKFLPK